MASHAHTPEKKQQRYQRRSSLKLSFDMSLEVLKAILSDNNKLEDSTVSRPIRDTVEEWGKYASKILTLSSRVYCMKSRAFAERKFLMEIEERDNLLREVASAIRESGEAILQAANVNLQTADRITNFLQGEPVSRARKRGPQGQEDSPLQFKRSALGDKGPTTVEVLTKVLRNMVKKGETIGLEFRKDLLQKLLKMVLNDGDRIAEEFKKNILQGSKKDSEEMITTVVAFINVYLQNMDEWAPKPQTKTFRIGGKDLEIETVYKPKGVVLVIGSWNRSPLSLFFPMVLSIAAGNCVVIMPPKEFTATSTLLKDLFKNFECISVIDKISEEDVLKVRFDHIFYMGSSTMGKMIANEAEKYFTPVTLEIAGKCPIFVDNEVNVDKTAQILVNCKWSNCGQGFKAPDYLLTSAEMKKKLLEALKKIISQKYGQNVQQRAVYARMVNGFHFDRVNHLLEASKGTVLHQEGNIDRSDLFIPPTIIEVNQDDAMMKVEIFGPILLIITVRDMDEAINIINAREKSEYAYFFSNNKDKEKKFTNTVSSGGVAVNDAVYDVSTSALPCGSVHNTVMGIPGESSLVLLSNGTAVAKLRTDGGICMRGGRTEGFA